MEVPSFYKMYKIWLKVLRAGSTLVKECYKKWNEIDTRFSRSFNEK